MGRARKYQNEDERARAQKAQKAESRKRIRDTINAKRQEDLQAKACQLEQDQNERSSAMEELQNLHIDVLAPLEEDLVTRIMELDLGDAEDGLTSRQMALEERDVSVVSAHHEFESGTLLLFPSKF